MKPILPALATLVALATGTARAQLKTRNPHGKLALECAVCHSPEGWVPAHVSAAFDHSKLGMTLNGAHATTACRSCHASLDFHGAARECGSCHQDVHHGELGNDCGRCHTPRSFIDRSGMTRAHQLTRFPLTGSHLTLDCEACHTPSPQGRMAFVSVSSQCVDCHRTQFQAAKNPDHSGGGFPQDCAQCHATTTWASARFNHDATGFSLTGMHKSVACDQCHASAHYAGTSTACLSCHQQAYDGTTNPAHAVAGFSTSCETCHTTNGWTGAAFNHTWFPVPHRTARVCSDCHTDPSNYTAFTCTTCHTQAGTDPHHQGMRGYTWSSTACYSCHRNGRGG